MKLAKVSHLVLNINVKCKLPHATNQKVDKEVCQVYWSSFINLFRSASDLVKALMKAKIDRQKMIIAKAILSGAFLESVV